MKQLKYEQIQRQPADIVLFNTNNINKQGFSFSDVISAMGGFSGFGGGGYGGAGGGSFGGGGLQIGHVVADWPVLVAAVVLPVSSVHCLPGSTTPTSGAII